MITAIKFINMFIYNNFEGKATRNHFMVTPVPDFDGNSNRIKLSAP